MLIDQAESLGDKVAVCWWYVSPITCPSDGQQKDDGKGQIEDKPT